MARTPKPLRNEAKKGATLAKAQQKNKVGLSLTPKQKNALKQADARTLRDGLGGKKNSSPKSAAAQQGYEKVESKPGQKVVKRQTLSFLNDGAAARKGVVSGGVTKKLKGK